MQLMESEAWERLNIIMHDNAYISRPLREDTHKKVFFLVVGPIRFYPPYTNGLVVHATYFFFFIFFSLRITWNGLTIFLSLQFLGKKIQIYRKKVFFCLVVGRGLVSLHP